MEEDPFLHPCCIALTQYEWRSPDHSCGRGVPGRLSAIVGGRQPVCWQHRKDLMEQLVELEDGLLRLVDASTADSTLVAGLSCRAITGVTSTGHRTSRLTCGATIALFEQTSDGGIEVPLVPMCADHVIAYMDRSKEEHLAAQRRRQADGMPAGMSWRERALARL